MYGVRNAILCTTCAMCVVLAPLTFGFDLVKYSRLDTPHQQRVCVDAARANPDIVKQLQSIAERYVKQIQSELAALTKSHPCLAGIGQAQIELRNANETEKVLCGLEFKKNTHFVETASGRYLEPDKDGCILRVWVNNICAFSYFDRRGGVSVGFLVHEIEMRANYFLSVSEENNDLYKTVRALIEKRFKEMSNEMKKLQTAQDRTADKF